MDRIPYRMLYHPLKSALFENGRFKWSRNHRSQANRTLVHRLAQNLSCDQKVYHTVYRQLRYRLLPWMGLFLFVGLSLACSAGDLVQRAIDPPVPTRALLPTYTPTPVAEQTLPQIIVTPPLAGTPGVIILPNGMDPALLTPTASTPTLLPTQVQSELATPDLAMTATASQFPPDFTPEPGEPVEPTLPAESATPVPTDTPTPTDTPIPTATFTPTPPPTPYAVVDSGLVSLRTGPGVEYPLAAQLGPRIPIAITGQNPEGTWYRLCCVNRDESIGNDGTVWVVSNHVQTVNDVSGVALVAVLEPPPAPTPTWTFTPTPTITPTPTATFVPFERAVGPQFFSTCNSFLTIWVKLFEGTPPDEVPLGGYYLEVLFGEDERPSTDGPDPSGEEFARIRVPGTGYGDLMYNLKYEYRAPAPVTPTPCPPSNLPSGNWKAYVVDSAGNRVSDIVEFTTNPTNSYREIYVAWKRVR